MTEPNRVNRSSDAEIIDFPPKHSMADLQQDPVRVSLTIVGEMLVNLEEDIDLEHLRLRLCVIGKLLEAGGTM